MENILGKPDSIDIWPALESWLDEATRGIGTLGKTRIRSEVGAHFREAYDACLAEGVAAEIAERKAVEALGDARKARGGFRRVYLTVGEEKHLRTLVFDMAKDTLGYSILGWPAMAFGALALALSLAVHPSGVDDSADAMAACYLLLGSGFVLRRHFALRGWYTRFMRWHTILVSLMIISLMYLLYQSNQISQPLKWVFVGCVLLVVAWFGPRQVAAWRKSRLFSPEDWTLLERRGGKKK